MLYFSKRICQKNVRESSDIHKEKYNKKVLVVKPKNETVSIQTNLIVISECPASAKVYCLLSFAKL
jgi:hypothetical protein